MQSRLIVNLFLLVIVLVLALFIYTSGDETSDKTRKLTDVKRETINKIRIKHKDRIIQLEKTGKQWQFTKPVTIAANNFRVASVLKIINTPSRASYTAEGLELAAYGLEQIQTTVLLNNINIEFGIVNPMNNYRYVKLDNTVHLIDDFYYPLISSQIGSLVSLSPLDTDAEIVKLVLPEQILEKNEQGKWHSNKEVSTDAILETITNWKNDQAFGVHNYLKRESLGNIEIYLKGRDAPLRFEITDIDPWLIIARPELDLEYHYNLEFYDRLLRPGAEKELPEELTE